MLVKAADGSWEISIATAGALLASALAKYYGLEFYAPAPARKQNGARLLSVNGPCQAASAGVMTQQFQLGRASCRERVCQSGSTSVVGGTLKKKKKKNNVD